MIKRQFLTSKTKDSSYNSKKKKKSVSVSYKFPNISHQFKHQKIFGRVAFNSYASIFYNSKFFSPHKTLSYCSLMLKIKLKLIAEVKCIRQKLYSNFAFGTVVFCWYVRFLVGTCGFKDFNTIVLILCPFITTQDCQHKQFSMHISFLIFCSPTL